MDNSLSKNIKIRHTVMLYITALLWGVAFVFQQIGGSAMGPYTFNALRMFIGAGVVSLAMLFTDKKGYSHKPSSRAERKQLLTVGVVCGLLLSVSTNLQQVALCMNITTGKAGFITALYIVLVPIIGLIFHVKCKWNTWIAVLIAVFGLYFLCMSGSFTVNAVDLILFACALGFAFQIICIDRLGRNMDGLRLSCIQFLVTAVTSLIPALIIEIIPYDGGFWAWICSFSDWHIWLSLTYLGIFSCGVGYTFQVIGMKGLNPTGASLIMSLESVFSLISGMVILKQDMTGRELFGCLLMFIAICLSQIDIGSLVKCRR